MGSDGRTKRAQKLRIHLLSQDIANSVRLLRSAFSGTVLIVEGGKDLRVYRRFVDNNQCKLVNAFCKDNAIGALNILEMNNFQGVLAIVDTDFWNLDGVRVGSPNLLVTDSSNHMNGW